MSDLIFYEPWQQYQTPCVRQLAFAIASGNILNFTPSELCIDHAFSFHSHDFWKNQFELYQSRLNFLDQNPSELLSFLAQLKSTRLGLRFEMLIWFWLLEHPSYEVLGHSIQKIDGSKTLGELDFVLFNHITQEIEHWEVALKYYLQEDYDLRSWFGLNKNDTLYKKLNHFTTRQFQFKDFNGQFIQKRYAVLKGQLYLNSQPTPNWVNASRRTGLWGTISISGFHRLKRQEWIIPDLLSQKHIAKWWTEGLYCNADQTAFYMYRTPSLFAI